MGSARFRSAAISLAVRPFEIPLRISFSLSDSSVSVVSGVNEYSASFEAMFVPSVFEPVAERRSALATLTCPQ